MASIFIQFGVLLIISFLVSVTIKALKQPTIIGYIIAGIVISSFLHFGVSQDIINTFSEFGVAFLLFIVGLHLNPKVIKEIGFSSLIIAISQIVITAALSFALVFWIFKFSILTSVYIALAITFSSTIVITKLLSDKKELESLYGKISIGVLIIQDLVAIFILMIISSSTQNVSLVNTIPLTLLKGIITIVSLFIISYFIIPKFTHVIARNQELLFLFSITWCFAFIALFQYLGFSSPVEIGALIAGITLSISTYSDEISSKIRPLRDFFIIIFFVILGLSIKISEINKIIFPALLISLFVIIIKPLIVIVTMALNNFTKRTNFITGITLAQISEFSLIILALGVKLNQISPEVLSIITLTGLITIAASTYFIIYSEEIYRKLSESELLNVFEKKRVKERTQLQNNYTTLLFGYNRIGFNLVESLKKIEKTYLVVDFNPDTIVKLKRKKIPSIYGDAYDEEFLNRLPLEKVKLVISTIPEFETNSLLIKNIKRINPEAIIVVVAHQINEAFELYGRGATYVLLPHFLGGEYVSKMIEKYKTDAKYYEAEKKKHIERLKKRIQEGQEHPRHERK